MEVIQFLRFYWKGYSICCSFMTYFNWQITTIIISSKFCCLNFSFFISSCFLFGWSPLLLPFISKNCITTSSLSTKYKIIYGARWLRLLMLHFSSLYFLFFAWKVIFREITEAWMRIFWCKFISPGLKVNVSSF